MSADFLHNHPQFPELIRIVAQQKGIDPALVEKDYWIMHCLYGLQQLGLTFELKGGTSLSKGFQIINRFSEDIDIRIEPPKDRDVKTGRNHDKPAHIESRRNFYDWLAKTIRINGIEKVERDTVFDNKTLMSAGIRLFYKTHAKALDGLKPGVLLELGFDDVTPNSKKDISSWVYDYAADKVSIIDNRAKAVACYDPGYTFVEKLQTVSTKFRQQQASREFPINFMRHYYDIYSLLRRPEVQAFIGTEAYKAHKTKRFRGGDNPNIAQNQAFILADPRRAKPTLRRSPKARRSITETSRRSSKSSKRSALGSSGCEHPKATLTASILKFMSDAREQLSTLADKLPAAFGWINALLSMLGMK